LQANKRIAFERKLGAGLEPQHGMKQFPEFVRFFGISYGLVLGEEARQVSACRTAREHRDQRVVTFLMRAIQRDADLVPDPIHHAVAANIHRKSRGPDQSGLQRVLPAAARVEVDLIDPDLQAVCLGLLARLEAAGETQGSLAVDP
jgi:hypothetical protein